MSDTILGTQKTVPNRTEILPVLKGIYIIEIR